VQLLGGIIVAVIVSNRDVLHTVQHNINLILGAYSERVVAIRKIKFDASLIFTYVYKALATPYKDTNKFVRLLFMFYVRFLLLPAFW